MTSAPLPPSSSAVSSMNLTRTRRKPGGRTLKLETGGPCAEIMPRWVERVNELLASADPDELVTLVDVHW